MPPEEPEKQELDGNAPIEVQEEIEEEIIAPASPEKLPEPTTERNIPEDAGLP